jgi:hypothetical protein
MDGFSLVIIFVLSIFVLIPKDRCRFLTAQTDAARESCSFILIFARTPGNAKVIQS